MFKNAIARTPGNDFASGLTTSGLGAPDMDLALEQPRAYIATLEGLGVHVEVLPPLTGFPDACFVEDTAVIVEEAAIITHSGAPSRVGETPTIAEAMAKYKTVIPITAPGATIDGGDVLLVGNDFYVGLSGRTNQAGVDAFSAALAPFNRYSVTPVPLPSGLHLKSDVTQIADNVVLITERMSDHPAFAKYRRVITPAGEEYGTNALLVNGTLIMSAGHPGAVKKCQDAGCNVKVLDMSEYKKMDGALTCLSLRF